MILFVKPNLKKGFTKVKMKLVLYGKKKFKQIQCTAGLALATPTKLQVQRGKKRDLKITPPPLFFLFPPLLPLPPLFLPSSSSSSSSSSSPSSSFSPPPPPLLLPPPSSSFYRVLLF